ncbi:MAG: hypothetical protein FWB86_12425 [Treponema sp.]|nr:hypothetical protein [Treponema sp.]MCL2251296.1 hypothetical protein [Treponema sp.]
MVNKSIKKAGMLLFFVVLCSILTSCWSTGNARDVVPVAALMLQRVRSTIMSDLTMKIFVDNTPYELENSMSTSIIVNNGEHMVYAVLGDIESKSVRFTAKSHTVVVNVSPKTSILGKTELNIEVIEAK